MKQNRITRLTKAEEQVMQILWDLEQAVVKDLVDNFGSRKPAYTTVATVLKVLEKKNFVTHQQVGNTHLFMPVISRVEYTKFQLSSLLTNYFNDSFPKMATFFARENDISITELEDLINETKDNLSNLKNNHDE